LRRRHRVLAAAGLIGAFASGAALAQPAAGTVATIRQRGSDSLWTRGGLQDTPPMR
jgi:hypothetical protein